VSNARGEWFTREKNLGPYDVFLSGKKRCLLGKTTYKWDVSNYQEILNELGARVEGQPGGNAEVWKMCWGKEGGGKSRQKGGAGIGD